MYPVSIRKHVNIFSIFVLFWLGFLNWIEKKKRNQHRLCDSFYFQFCFRGKKKLWIFSLFYVYVLFFTSCIVSFCFSSWFGTTFHYNIAFEKFWSVFLLSVIYFSLNLDEQKQQISFAFVHFQFFQSEFICLFVCLNVVVCCCCFFFFYCN